jgi:hypothetical protein
MFHSLVDMLERFKSSKHPSISSQTILGTSRLGLTGSSFNEYPFLSEV